MSPGIRNSEGITGYFPRRGESYYPPSIARGGWGESMSGHVAGGLLGWAVERAVDDSAFQPARLTVDLPRPTTLEPVVDVQTRVIRNGKRLRLGSVTLFDQGKIGSSVSVSVAQTGFRPPA